MSDVVVIGAGVMGASIALELSRRNRAVVVVDKGGAVGGGSTSASASVVRFNYSTLEGVLASWEAKHHWDTFGDDLGIDGPVAHFVATGMVMFDPPGHDRRPTLGHFRTVGVPHEVLEPDELRRRMPAIDNGRFWPPRAADDPQFFDPAHGALDALWLPDAGFVDDPQLAAANLMAAAAAGGTTVRLGSEVRRVEVADGAVRGVWLDDGEFVSGRCVVNAAGPWSAQVNACVDADPGVAVGTRPLRQELHTMRAPPGFRLDDGGIVVGDFDLGTYFRAHFGDTILVGGVEADCDPLEWLTDADDCNPSATSVLFESQTHRVARRVPGSEVPLRPIGLAAPYDVTPDWIPVYDRTDIDGYYVAIGTSGNQFKNAPIVGGILAAIIEASEAGHDHDAEPVGYECRAVGQRLDLGHFSRRRAPRATSGTVLG